VAKGSTVLIEPSIVNVLEAVLCKRLNPILLMGNVLIVELSKQVQPFMLVKVPLVELSKVSTNSINFSGVHGLGLLEQSIISDDCKITALKFGVNILMNGSTE